MEIQTLKVSHESVLNEMKLIVDSWRDHMKEMSIRSWKSFLHQVIKALKMYIEGLKTNNNTLRNIFFWRISRKKEMISGGSEVVYLAW